MTGRSIHGQGRRRARKGAWFLAVSALVLLAVLAAWFLGRGKVPPPAAALEKVSWDSLGPLSDDMDPDSLLQAVGQSLAHLDRLGPEAELVFGKERVAASRVADSLRAFGRLVRERPGAWEPEVRKRFEAWRSTGEDGAGRMLFTGYYAPLFPGSLAPSPEYPVPLYRRPPDLVTLDLGLFKKDLAGQDLNGLWNGKTLVPYPTREEIDAGGRLAGRGLEIAWVKSPADALFLQVQGSGRLRLPDGGTVSVLYDGRNGRAYTPVGRVLIREGLVPREKMSMQAIREYLTTHPGDAARVMYTDQSYVFFRLAHEPPQGCTGAALTPGRSVAVDRRLFPMGALAWITSQKPAMAPDGSIASWQPFSRFVLLQDTGGAIRGPGRLDVFWGSGDYAEAAAGHMKHEGGMLLILLKE